eukprot:CAMPEP_0202889530 /NCGR_PEP_ID=MMETSP1392-20130828/114_1 /ASSEMBLY_ACC=CAM_ASM_000868 /TAXON_ID=225041 /ORGANISM="Chlamydomonas chlamydogama, Strain SAG 11-48b" /LENGTH=252 /DNA_ID=CAMNT_0049572881 /DNA_START=51 /DNA_END=809 /DNA_ORIENTATION=+
MSLNLMRKQAARPSVATKVGKTIGSKTETPVSTTPRSNLDYLRSLPGVSEPFPDVFDPAGFATKATIPEIRRWRESELTHGRVSMLASLGFIVGEQLEDFPAFLNWDGSVSGPAITHFDQIRDTRPLFWESLILAIGLAESYRVAVGWATPTGNGFNNLKDDYEPGNLGFDPLGLAPSDPEELKELQTKELNNGRLAMIAIAAFVVQEVVEQTEIFEHLALRFEKEAILELDDIERDLNLPITPLPENLKNL